jgi:rRNA-processing protein EBP2
MHTSEQFHYDRRLLSGCMLASVPRRSASATRLRYLRYGSSLKGTLSFRLTMPRQKFTFKKLVSQPRDEAIKDTNSNLVQPTHSDELDVNELDESHDEEEGSGDGEEDGADAESAPREESEAGEGVALDDDDVDSVDQDAIPRRKVQVDNKVRHFPLFTGQPVLVYGQIALERIRDTIKLDQSLPWTETLTVSFPETIDVDVDDDLGRELAL